jgi:16S rRNA (guanine527-N7)-methyltransferase
MGPGLPERLEARARAVGLDLESSLRDRLLAYYELLSKWNRTINLTSLSDPDAAVDRLLLEPLLAAKVLPKPDVMMDLGSGGGSPAIPLALALAAPHLVMVESRERKAAFLREAARTLGLNATVEAARFEDLSGRPEYTTTMDIVSVRAVRMDRATLDVARGFTRPDGSVALFTSGTEMERVGAVTPLLGRANLIRIIVPRGTSSPESAR